MQLVLGPGSAALHIWLDLPAADALQLHLTAASVAQSLTAAPKIKLADKHVKCVPMMSIKSDLMLLQLVSSWRAAGCPCQSLTASQLQQLGGIIEAKRKPIHCCALILLEPLNCWP